MGGPYLACGTAKGNLLIYNKKTLKKINIVNKHTKRITSAAWSKENQLVLTSDDRQVTVSNTEGDTLHTLMLKMAGSDVQFARKGGQPQDNVVSIAVGQQSLQVVDIDAPSGNLEGTDVKINSAKYGNLVGYAWFGDGQVALGFDSGYFVVMNNLQAARRAPSVACARSVGRGRTRGRAAPPSPRRRSRLTRSSRTGCTRASSPAWRSRPCSSARRRAPRTWSSWWTWARSCASCPTR